MTDVKTISSAADLAINGAPPAFDQPLHVGRPNVGSRELFQSHVDGMFDRCWLTNNGPLVQELEQRIADLLGVRHCVAVCNGTVGLEIAIRAAGFSGEVIVPSYSFVATAHALHWQGITPVFADINPVTHLLDSDSVRRAITPRTTGILATHLWGRGCDVAALEAIAAEHDLGLLFDAAHAFLASHGGKMIGGFGAAEVFSFHATKFFNTFEGGAITTNDDALAEAMRLMRNFGFAGLDTVIHPGTNGKMPEICAAMGLANLATIDAVVAHNRRNYADYLTAFADIEGLSIMEFSPDERRNYQYVVLECDDRFGATRDEIVAALNAENVIARKYFWPGCHRMMPYRELDPDAGEHLPNTQRVADRVVVLPTGTALPPRAVETIRDVCMVLGRTRTNTSSEAA